jgi:excisionase family DNA binding protein
MTNPTGKLHDTLLSTATVARWLGISTRTVCFWAECGEIPALKVGRQWRFREDEVRQWLDTTQARLLDRRQLKSA